MAKKRKLTRDGRIFRDGSTVVVEVLDSAGSLGRPGVTCVNPDDPEKERIYRKVFEKKLIYLPPEYDRAADEHLSSLCALVLSMNGYSSITPEQCLRYGVQDGAYEEACAAILRNSIRHLQDTFPAVTIKLLDGASDMGIDRSLADVAEEFAMVTLGFSCPRFMLYVPDDGRAVYVAADQASYGDFFIKSLDLLIGTGGRKQALQHDVAASCIYGKHIHFVDVLNMLSTTGGVPATIQMADGTIVVDNAAAAFGRNITFCSPTQAVMSAPAGGDKWDATFSNVASVATEVCRSKMPPRYMFR